MSPLGEIRRFHLEIGHSRESCRSVRKKNWEGWGGRRRICESCRIFFMTTKRTINTLVSFDRTDKNKVSFESAKGLLLFLYSHNNNEIMCFSKINKINRVRSLPGLCLCHLSDT